MTTYTQKVPHPIYSPIHEAIIRHAAMSWVADVSVLVDLLYQVHLRDVSREVGITDRQVLAMLQDIALEFRDNYDAQSDPRRLLHHIFRRWIPQVCKMQPDEGTAEAVCDMDEDELQALREILGDVTRYLEED